MGQHRGSEGWTRARATAFRLPVRAETAVTSTLLVSSQDTGSILISWDNVADLIRFVVRETDAGTIMAESQSEGFRYWHRKEVHRFIIERREVAGEGLIRGK